MSIFNRLFKVKPAPKQNIATSFKKAEKKLLTYSEVMHNLNSLGKRLPGSFAGFSKNLVTSEGEARVGFVCSDHSIEIQLASLLETLGFKFEHYYADINNGKAELHIAPEDAKHAIDIFDGWQSNVTVEPIYTENHALIAQWSRIVNVR